jgi:hypothetical protein
MRLQDVFVAAKFQICGGAEYGWDCFGRNTYMIDFLSRSFEPYSNSGSVVFNRDTQEVCVIEVNFDMTRAEKKDVPFRWVNPKYQEVYKQATLAAGMREKEAWDDIDFIEKDCESEILEILELSMSHFDGMTCQEELEMYVHTCQIELDLERDELFELMLQAHNRGITLNQLFQEVLEIAVDKAKSIIAEHEESIDVPEKFKVIHSFVLKGKIFGLKQSEEHQSVYLLEDDEHNPILKVTGADISFYNSLNSFEKIGEFCRYGEKDWWCARLYYPNNDDGVGVGSVYYVHSVCTDFSQGLYNIITQLINSNRLNLMYNS